ncbi:hypothetical protein Q3G72_025855 [Acer saccharum]|nr:hypothetical protein Q3G72_025855 [Acer saccharum]
MLAKKKAAAKVSKEKAIVIADESALDFPPKSSHSRKMKKRKTDDIDPKGKLVEAEDSPIAAEASNVEVVVETDKDPYVATEPDDQIEGSSKA